MIFGYNGRDRVVTDKNGLIYMRVRYYSPDMRRFVNADIIHGEISDSTSLNRYLNILGFEIELGANADVITVGAKAEVSIFRNEDGKIKFQNKSKADFGWFGWGLNLGITLPF